MLLTVLVVALGAAVVPAVDDVHIAKDWLVALQSTLYAGSSAADVERVVAMYAPDVVYEHPRVGMRIEGRDEVRRGMLRFQGAYAGGRDDVRMKVADLRAAPGVVVVDMTVSLKARSESGAATDVSRRQIVVIHVKDGRITRVLDHW